MCRCLAVCLFFLKNTINLKDACGCFVIWIIATAADQWREVLALITHQCCNYESVLLHPNPLYHNLNMFWGTFPFSKNVKIHCSFYNKSARYLLPIQIMKLNYMQKFTVNQNHKFNMNSSVSKYFSSFS